MRYYLDTEFDGFRGALISLALVAEDDRSLSIVVQDWADDPWVKENVIPHLWKADASTRLWTPEEAAIQVARFLYGDRDPIIISDWPADIRYFCELIEFPGGEMAPIAALRFEMHRVDAYPTTLPGAVQHNAWWDAMALRHVLSKLPPGPIQAQRGEPAHVERIVAIITAHRPDASFDDSAAGHVEREALKANIIAEIRREFQAPIPEPPLTSAHPSTGKWNPTTGVYDMPAPDEGERWPPLPAPLFGLGGGRLFTADQLRAFAREYRRLNVGQRVEDAEAVARIIRQHGLRNVTLYMDGTDGATKCAQAIIKHMEGRRG